MKKISNRGLIFIYCLFSSGLLIAADTGINPSILQLKVYKLAVSTSSLCTDLITVIDEENPDYTDILANPTLGSGQVSDGTYPCVVLQISDQVKFKPDADSDSGNCVTTNAIETLDVCSSGSSTLIDGTVSNCSAGDNTVAMYLSTTSTSTTGSDAFNAPTVTDDASKGFKLGSALVISGTSSGVFKVDGSGQVCDGDAAGNACEGGGSPGRCNLAPPLFTFEQN